MYPPTGVGGGGGVTGPVAPSPLLQAVVSVTRSTAAVTVLRHISDMPHRERFIITLLLGALGALLTACSGSKDAPTSPGQNTGTTPVTTPVTTTVDVFTPGLVFSPAFLTISVGSIVRFNITGVAHDVTFRAVTGAPASIPVTSNQIVSRTFNTKGIFPYDCRTHPGMSASITVQ